MEKQYISEIVINNFRNYVNRKIEFFSDFNVIVGANGVGKTNILEAISIFSNSRGLRNAEISELININTIKQKILFSLFIRFFNFNLKNKLVIIQEEGGKTIKFNDETLKKSSQLTDMIKITYLTPQMDGFFTGSSSDRRKFVDKTAELLFVNHYDNVKKYEFFIKERIKILTTQTTKDKWLDIVERKIAELGTSIANVRNETIGYLNKIFENYTNNFPTGHLILNGEVETQLRTKKSMEIEDNYRRILSDNRSGDMQSKKTTFGVHRSDIDVFNKDKNIKASLCSTGEQKMLLISLIIVRTLFSKKINRGVPVLLLDEICSHIDNNAKLNLFEELKKLDVQVFLTGINRSDFTDLTNNFIELCSS
ncbi:MAG: DNA replication/repair protein RecF [Rickettsiales bacterium]|jgi:DNA replication and repair protein RecF|nr:DNA replication/repair protein RecF [Rickettsiales bacterium]